MLEFYSVAIFSSQFPKGTILLYHKRIKWNYENKHSEEEEDLGIYILDYASAR